MPNLPELLIAHFAVPLAGGVLVAINTRLPPGSTPPGFRWPEPAGLRCLPPATFDCYGTLVDWMPASEPSLAVSLVHRRGQATEFRKVRR